MPDSEDGRGGVLLDDGHFLTRPVVVFVLLSLLALLIYVNSLSCPFILDDRQNIVENLKLRDLSNFLDMSGSRYVGYLSFALNYAMGGFQVFGYHLTNVLIHLANGYLVYGLIMLLAVVAFSNPPASVRWVALFSAVLFVAHPIQTQSVTYIVQRFSSLVTTFYLLTLVCYLKWRLLPPHTRSRTLWYIAALCSCVFAMKTKENSFTLPAVMLLVEWIFFSDRKWKALIPFLLTLLIVPLSHIMSVTSTGEGIGRDTETIGRLSYLFTQFRVIVTYLRLLVLPIHQSLDYDYPVFHSLWDAQVLASFLVLSSLVGMAVMLLRRASTSSGTERGFQRLMAFGIFWFFVTLSIESSIIPIKDVFFEHRIYLPSVGFFLVIALMAAWIWERLPGARWLVVLLAAAMVCGYSVATIARNRIWQKPVTLWEDVVRKAPNKARPHNNLGEAYQDLGRLDDALREFQTALQLNPNFAEIHYNVGETLARKGRLDEAIQSYQMAIAMKPGYAKAHLNLGSVYAQKDRLDEALKEFQTVITLQPENSGAHNNLGNIYTLQGRFADAIREYQLALKLRPDFVEARKNMDHAMELNEK